jgi:hypothetical protein
MMLDAIIEIIEAVFLEIIRPRTALYLVILLVVAFLVYYAFFM